MNKKMLLIPIIIGIFFVLPMICATTTMTTPVAFGNYTTSPFTVTVVVGGNIGSNMTNVSCYYNATGGPVVKNMTYRIVEMLNTTSYQTTFTGTGTLTTDLRTYNVTCFVYNGTTLNMTLTAGNVTIEGGLPGATLSLESTSIGTGDSNTIQWTSSDSLSGLNTVVTTVTSPDTSACATKTYTTTSGKYALVGPDTECEGTYTVLVTATDYSGNVKTATKTFEAAVSGLSKSGSNTLGGVSKSNLGQKTQVVVSSPNGNGTNVAIIVVLLAAAYLYFRRK